MRNALQKKVTNAMMLIRDKLSGGGVDVAILGKEGNKSTKKPIRVMSDFLTTYWEWNRD